MLNILACLDCIHVIPHENESINSTHARCGHEFEYNYVTGEKDYKFCDLVRKHGACGTEARYFEPKQDPRNQEFDDQDGGPIPSGAPF